MLVDERRFSSGAEMSVSGLSHLLETAFGVQRRKGSVDYKLASQLLVFYQFLEEET